MNKNEEQPENVPAIQDVELYNTVTAKIQQLPDSDCLEVFKDMLQRVGISNHFVKDEQEVITHQFLAAQCGKYSLVSELVELEVPLEVSDIDPKTETIN